MASEGNDEIALVKFGVDGARVERKHKIGTNPTELLGPHGLAVSPDGKFYYVTTAHGAPNGALWKFSTDSDQLLGHVTLGMFPATVQVSPDGHYVWTVNFNLHGEPVPSSVSVSLRRPDDRGEAAGDVRDAARLASDRRMESGNTRRA